MQRNNPICNVGFYQFHRVISKVYAEYEVSGTNKFILATHICTHLELEKLVYMCYADYLCSTHKKLFEDKIYAFKYGPVIKSVYEEYKGMKDIEEGLAVDEHLDEDYAKMPARSRILFAEDGIEKIAHIDATLEKYSCLSATELVNITHGVYEVSGTNKFFIKGVRTLSWT